MSRTAKTDRARVAYKTAKAHRAAWNRDRVHAPEVDDPNRFSKIVISDAAPAASSSD